MFSFEILLTWGLNFKQGKLNNIRATAAQCKRRRCLTSKMWQEVIHLSECILCGDRLSIVNDMVVVSSGHSFPDRITGIRPSADLCRRRAPVYQLVPGYKLDRYAAFWESEAVKGPAAGLVYDLVKPPQGVAFVCVHMYTKALHGNVTRNLI